MRRGAPRRFLGPHHSHAPRLPPRCPAASLQEGALLASAQAYGQTGSGKTFTMGTSYTAGAPVEGILPSAMALVFKRVGELSGAAARRPIAPSHRKRPLRNAVRACRPCLHLFTS